MREILFRGKRISDNKWIYGDLILLDGDYCIYINGNTKAEKEGTGSWAVYEDTVSQFTNVYDKKGNKIFDGDYVRDNYHTMLVEWDDTRWLTVTSPISLGGSDRLIGCVSKCSKNGTSAYEIIGNRWDDEVVLG